MYNSDTYSVKMTANFNVQIDDLSIEARKLIVDWIEANAYSSKFGNKLEFKKFATGHVFSEAYNEAKPVVEKLSKWVKPQGVQVELTEMRLIDKRS